MSRLNDFISRHRDLTREQVHILNLDGGGVRAIIPLAVLRMVEKIAKQRIQETFHVYSGASAGGLLTSALNILNPDGRFKHSPNEIMMLYKLVAKEIFKVPLWRRFLTCNGLIKSKYSGEQKLQVLKDFYGNLRMDQLGNTVLINAFDVHTYKTHLFGSNFSTMEGGEKLLVADVVNATSAAPTMFESFLIENLNLVDGGIVANNPEMIAYMLTSSLYPNAKIHMLSLGTGITTGLPQKGKAIDWGQLQWLVKGNLINILLTSDMVLANDLMEMILGGNLVQYLRLEPELPKTYSSGFDASSDHLDQLEAFATTFAKSKEPEIKTFLDKLSINALSN